MAKSSAKFPTNFCLNLLVEGYLRCLKPFFLYLSSTAISMSNDILLSIIINKTFPIQCLKFTSGIMAGIIESVQIYFIVGLFRNYSYQRLRMLQSSRVTPKAAKALSWVYELGGWEGGRDSGRPPI